MPKGNRMDGKKMQFSALGIILVLLGVLLLLHKMHFLRIEFSQVLWLLAALWGIVEVTRGFTRSRKGKIFWGTVLFLFGVFFFLRTLDTFYFHEYMIPSAAFLIFGIAYLMMYLNNLREWYLLIPAILLIGVGGAFTLAEIGYLSRWEVWDAVRMYWPVSLILIGFGIIARRRMHLQSEPPAP